MNWKKTLLISIIILLIGGAVTVLIFWTEPTASRGGATKETAMLVEIQPVQRGSYRPIIVATGTVQPAKDITLSPRVTGQIIKRSSAFVPGGYVQKGQMLLKIDPSDFKNTLQLRKSDLSQALANLNIEKGRQEIAEQDYELVGDTLAQDNKSLVLREPQLQSVQAQVEAARANVEQAELALSRTSIKAPFNAQILTRNVNVGSQVAPGNNLGRLVGVNEYWIETTISLSKLRWLSLPDGGGAKGSKVEVRNRTAWPEGAYREGYVDKLVGALDTQTRMARLLVAVPDPLAYWKSHAGQPKLMIGAFVEASIQAKEITDVVRLTRDYVRENETVWVMEDGELRIRDAEIVFEDSKYAYIASGLEDGDRVVMTNLATVVDGTPLRLESTSKQDSLSTAQNDQ